MWVHQIEKGGDRYGVEKCVFYRVKGTPYSLYLPSPKSKRTNWGVALEFQTFIYLNDLYFLGKIQKRLSYVVYMTELYTPEKKAALDALHARLNASRDARLAQEAIATASVGKKSTTRTTSSTSSGDTPLDERRHKFIGSAIRALKHLVSNDDKGEEKYVNALVSAMNKYDMIVVAE